MTMVDLVPIGMKRDLSASEAQYEWSKTGAGSWSVGGNATATDGERVLQTVEALAPTLNAIASMISGNQASIANKTDTGTNDKLQAVLEALVAVQAGYIKK